jgi:hypothetical protein
MVGTSNVSVTSAPYVPKTTTTTTPVSKESLVPLIEKASENIMKNVLIFDSKLPLSEGLKASLTTYFLQGQTALSEKQLNEILDAINEGGQKGAAVAVIFATINLKKELDTLKQASLDGTLTAADKIRLKEIETKFQDETFRGNIVSASDMFSQIGIDANLLLSDIDKTIVSIKQNINNPAIQFVPLSKGGVTLNEIPVVSVGDMLAQNLKVEREGVRIESEKDRANKALADKIMGTIVKNKILSGHKIEGLC